MDDDLLGLRVRELSEEFMEDEENGDECQRLILGAYQNRSDCVGRDEVHAEVCEHRRQYDVGVP
jgi:hypothetical protein